MTATATTVWRPNPGPQTALLTCPVGTVFYGGARGGGKTDGLIGDWVSHAGRYGVRAKGLLFRRTLVELDDVIERARAIMGPLGWTHNASKHEFRGPDGALLRMRYLERDADAQAYQGHSYTWIGGDEVGNFPSPKPIDLLSGTLRSADGVPCSMRLTGNPGGPGHGWVKRRFIDPHPEGLTPFTYDANGVEIEAVYIPSTLDDNPFLGVAYESQIAQATLGDETLYKAWRYGDWDVFVGQMYQVVRGVHILPARGPETFPAWTTWFATQDWGFVQGSYGLWAVDGDGRLHLAWELYDELQGRDVVQTASVIYEAHRRHGWPLPSTIHADEQMWQQHGSVSVSLVEEYRAAWARLMPQPPAIIAAEHRPGSRATKCALIHQWLAPDGARDVAGLPVPAMTFSDRCVDTIRVLQEIPRDPKKPNDVDPQYSDDHPHDMVGFAVASRPVRAKAPVIPWDGKTKTTVEPADRASNWVEEATRRQPVPHRGPRAQRMQTPRWGRVS